MIYRFRGINRVLNDGELKNNYFYFTSPIQQNDPLEGYVNCFWKGDKIAWLGLFKSYIWQLYMVLSNVPIYGEDINGLKDLAFWESEIDFKGLPILETRREVECEFVEFELIGLLAEELGNLDCELSIHQVQQILLFIHIDALKFVNKKVAEKFNITLLNIVDSKDYFDDSNIQRVQNFMKMLTNHSLIDPLAKGVEKMIESNNMIKLIDFKEGMNTYNTKMVTFLYSEFAFVYMKRIKQLPFTNWYCVCFNENVSNPALWGYYAEGHQGICLVFKKNVNEYFELEAIAKEDIERTPKLKLERVKYGVDPVKIDFFSGLGRLWGDERRHWFNHNDEWSSVWEKIIREEKEWRENYWKNSRERLLRKSFAWKDEKEVRIALEDTWYIHEQHEFRKFKYNFNDLDGIIFGISTSQDNKMEIIKIIKEKCIIENRTDFCFYDAKYDDTKNQIIYELNVFLTSTIKEAVQNAISLL